MKFTISWLKEYLETDCNLNSIVDRLNEIGLEVDNVTDNSEVYKNFNCVVVEECINHPDSDPDLPCISTESKESIHQNHPTVPAPPAGLSEPPRLQ